ncbi:MAG: 50S ribosomal protein L29 [Candidatus Saccharibacteria bacterium]|nr:50S ribosomal protein L29 [Candidatus Saccharibacteria bacterium]
MSEADLIKQLANKKGELLTAQKSLIEGTLQNPHQIKTLKKEIARLLTKINQQKGAQ